MNLEILSNSSLDLLIAKAATTTTDLIKSAWAEQRAANIVITGGRTGAIIAAALSEKILNLTTELEKTSLGKIEIWFSDERFADFSDANRNDQVLISAFKSLTEFENSTGQKIINFNSVQGPAQSDLETSALQYSQELEKTLGSIDFDCTILSMGEDGHIASIFPGQDLVLQSIARTAAVKNSPKPPSERITLTLHQLAKSKQVLIFVIGEGKRNALNTVKEGSNAAVVERLRQNSAHGQIILLTDFVDD